MRKYFLLSFIFLGLVSFAKDKTISSYNKKAFKILDKREHDCTFLVSNKEFNLNGKKYDVDKLLMFINSTFPKTFLTYGDLEFIIEVCEEYNIDVIFFLSKMEAENSVVTGRDNGYSRVYRRNFCMGAGMYLTKIDKQGKKYKPNSGFRKQVILGAQSLRHWYNRFKLGDSVLVNLDKDTVFPSNAASYALLKYTPFTKVISENGSVSSTNTDFRLIYLRFVQLYDNFK